MRSRTRSLHRLFVVFVVVAGPSIAACELAFDFDRTPLQPVYEGGAGVASDAGSDGHTASDAKGGG
jgi:hypothetical protein